MFTSLIVGLSALSAVAVQASPAAVKRSYAPGQCGVHFNQQTRTNNDDLVTFTVKDANGDTIGTQFGGLSDAEPETITSQLPYLITCTQPQQSHDIDCNYNGETFGTTDPTCGVGGWDDGEQGTRQADCGFSC